MFPTDFSEVSLHALKNCVPKLFKMGAKELIVIHVVDVFPGQAEIVDRIEIRAKERLDEVIETLKEKGINATGRVCLGPIPSSITEEARCPHLETVEEKGVDLIVIPSKGKNIKRKMHIGSTAMNVIRKSSVPVLLLKYDWNEREGSIECLCDCSKMFQKPLIALDFSSCSDIIVSTVRKFNEKVEKALLYHIIDYGSVEEMEENIKESKKILKLFSDKLGVESTIEVDVGITSKEILAKSIDFEATLIVIGKTGRGLVRDIIMGSTTCAVVREANIPVLVVHC